VAPILIDWLSEPACNFTFDLYKSYEDIFHPAILPKPACIFPDIVTFPDAIEKLLELICN
jgi:hypothetical protein